MSEVVQTQKQVGQVVVVIGKTVVELEDQDLQVIHLQ